MFKRERNEIFDFTKESTNLSQFQNTETKPKYIRNIFVSLICLIFILGSSVYLLNESDYESKIIHSLNKSLSSETSIYTFQNENISFVGTKYTTEDFKNIGVISGVHLDERFSESEIKQITSFATKDIEFQKNLSFMDNKSSIILIEFNDIKDITYLKEILAKYFEINEFVNYDIFSFKNTLVITNKLNIDPSVSTFIEKDLENIMNNFYIPKIIVEYFE